MKIINRKVYLRPIEAGRILGVSYKTVERWEEEGIPLSPGQPKKKILEAIRTSKGYRYFSALSVEDAAELLNPGYSRKLSLSRKESAPLFFDI
jgi:DNA-binding transcriptional MerR regulator